MFRDCLGRIEAVSRLSLSSSKSTDGNRLENTRPSQVMTGMSYQPRSMEDASTAVVRISQLFRVFKAYQTYLAAKEAFLGRFEAHELARGPRAVHQYFIGP